MLRVLDEAGHIKLHAPQKYDSMEKEATYLRAKQPTVLDTAQSTARALSAKADLICIASVGQTCGCEKVLVAERYALPGEEIENERSYAGN